MALGEVERGIGHMDEAMVDVTSGDTSPVIAGIAYCSVIAACHQVFDVRRAQEWTAALDSWCESQPQLVHFRGLCLLLRAELRQFHGAWDARRHRGARGERATENGADRTLFGEAIYEAAELHRLRGEFAEAEAAYRHASRLGKRPEPGIALLRLAQGQQDVAAATMARATDEATGIFDRAASWGPWRRSCWPPGRLRRPGWPPTRWCKSPATSSAPLLSAMAERAHGAAVLLAEADPRAALAALRPSWTAWQALDAPYEAARTRVLIGLACRAVDDADAATLELDAAADAFRELGAGPDLDRVEALLDERSSPVNRWPHRPRARGPSARRLRQDQS